LGYVLTAGFAVLVGCIAVAAMFVRSETRPVDGRPGLTVRKLVRRVAQGDLCRCGGTVGITSGQSGDVLGCTDCGRWWGMDGRSITQP
jgi:aerobic-type carbon monoxide dehydrogenase small subunit (CoxS/CutS family)